MRGVISMAEFIKVDALGDACPLPVVKAKKAISELQGAGQVEVLVDNEIAVQNLTKMAQQKGYQYSAEKLEERKYRVLFTLGEVESAPAEAAPVCVPDARTDTVVAISAAVMGEGSEELGKTLLKAFVFALTQQDKLPKTILFYNGGAALTCEGSAMLEDLKALEVQGVEILTCGTCLNFYGLTEKLAVGSVTNMYTIAEKLTQAGNVVKP
ncbi:sulfurtransferase-like selenium metabolism protein YedF [Faecalibacterium sp. OM04-11BH]|nr:sulfurtransferase-like selenium metabolism protein YedF [Faecalibacterium sp. OM04-11BH]